MNESFSAFVRVLTTVLWGPHVLLLILLAGVWFTLRGRFMQVTKLPGMTRGVFTNEAGLGSGTFATFRTENKTPEQIGTLGALQVFIDTILLCTITALCMLVSPVRDFSPEAALSVFSLVLGRFGELSAGVCVALFAFASVLAWSCYGMDALLYLLPKKGAAEKRIYMAFTALSCFLGCMSPFLGVLNVCDVFNGLMALLNVPALLVLTPQVFAKQIAQKPKKV